MKNKKNSAMMRSKSRAIALEPRLLFDGAGAVGVADALDNNYVEPEQSQHEADYAEADTNSILNTDELHVPGAASPSALVIIDSRVENFQSLLADLPANTVVRVVGSEESGLAAISAELAKGGNFDAVHILSHGTPGSFTLGSDQVDSSTLANQAEQLSSWSLSLTEEADILLYGCDVAEGEAGQAFISELAHLTGADISASSNATGAAEQGGDWVLESATGSIEAQGFEVEAYGGLLGTVPEPTVTIKDLPAANEVFIGGEFDFTLEFKNPGTDGFGPYVDLYLPKGADGDDGIDIAATGKITYLGDAVNYQVITLDVSGKADHPYAKNADGSTVKLSGIAGQKVVVIELPFGSFTVGQPAADLKVSASVSNKADLGTALTIKAQAGFRYGNSAVGAGGSVVADAAGVTTAITPTLIEYSYTFSGPEGETATGPNFPREMTTHIKVAPGQTLTGYELKIDLPNNVVVTHIDGVPLGTPITGSAAVNEVTKALGSITGNKDVVIKYYIPDTKGGGGDVLDTTSGAASSSQFQVSGSGSWTPLDTRDAPGVQSYNPAGVEYEHAIKSLAVQKTVTGTNKPGGSLNYQLDFQVSDYFQFKDVVITDVIDDGHALVDPVLKITYQGTEYTVPLAGHFTSVTDPVTHDITRTYNVSAALIASEASLPEGLKAGILTGGKFGANDSSGTFGRIEYTATINDKFVSVPADKTDDIKHGDTLKTNATISGNVVKVGGEAGSEITDATNTEVAIVTGGMKLDVVKVNGTDVPANGIKPGDTVTYELTYDLSNGDFADLKLDAFLPKPVFDVSGGWLQDSQGAGDPAAGHWKLMDTSVMPDGVASLDTDAASNGMKFSLGNRTDTTNTEGKIVIRFTVTVADDPFVDGLFLTAQAQGQDNNTPGDANSHQAIKKIQLNEPVLEIKHGIVSKTGEGVIAGTAGTWQAPGLSGQPFTDPITSIDGINGNITKIDAGDKVTFATGIINKGGSAAYDIATSTFIVPEGFKLIKQDGSNTANLSEANLKVYKGNGTLLTAGTDYNVSAAGEITLTKDGADLGVGRNDTATVNDGSNILVITYDAVALTTIAAGKATTSSFSVEKYAGKEGGKDFLPGAVKITDTATAAVAEPSVKIVFKDGSIDNDDSSSDSTTGANMVIGETMIYDIVVTLPEGTTHDLYVKALVPDGMMLDTSYNSVGYEVITTKGTAAGQSDALSGTFSDTAPSVSSVTGDTGALSADPVFKFGNVTVTDDNTTTNNSFVIRVKLIAANTNTTGSGAANNQDDQTRIPSASLTYDKGGNTTGSDNDKSIAATGNNSTITIREPKLTIVKTVDTDATTAGVQSDKVDAGDTIEYTITIKHAADSYDAYDLTFDDTFDSVLGMNTSANWSVMQGATDISDQFEWVVVDDKDKLQTKADANVDLAKGETIVIKVQGTTNASVAAKASFDSDATVRWSSINSANASERDTNERDGSGGIGTDADVLNNYAAKDGAKVDVNASYTLSRVGGLADTVAPDNTATDAQNVAVGEIVRFRVVMQIPEGEIPGLSMIPQLGAGYELIGDGATWALVGENAGLFLVNGSVDGVHFESNGSATRNIENTLNSSNTAGTTGRPGGAATLTDGKFTLGTIKNTDTDNSKAEYIVLEFNAIVKNDAANTAGTALSSKVEIQTAGTKLGESNITKDTVVEPQISAIVKNVVDIAPGPQSGDPHQITVSNTFTTGSTNAAPAYDVKLVEQFPGGSEYTITGVKIGGTSYTVDALPAGVTAVVTGTDSGIELNFEKLEPGTAVEVLYTVKVPTTAEQAGNTDTNATLTWSSLPGDETPVNNLKFAGATGGDDGAATGERIGTGGVNSYLRTDPAGYGTISGTLWDDTKNRDGSIDADEALLSGVKVTLKWTNPAGAERTLTTTTDANGKYSFGALPLGDYTITAPDDLTFTIDGDEDELKPRFDADGSANGLGTIKITLGEGAAQAEQNIGYLQENDAPTVIFTDTAEREFTEGVNTPGDTSVLGTAVNMGAVTIADLELERGLDSYNGTTLIVGRNNAGDDGFSANVDDVLGFDSTKVTVDGANIKLGGTTVATFTNVGGLLTITFNNAADTAAVTTVASAITYANKSQHPDLEHDSSYNINLRYRFNDANDNDKQGYGGSLTGDAKIGVKIIVQNDPPVATDNTNSIGEKATLPVTGNVRSDGTPDSDPDTAFADLKVTVIVGEEGTESIAANSTSASNGTVVEGKYGTLTIGEDGSYSYAVDKTNPVVHGLKDGESVIEEFTYTLSDGSLADTAKLNITINGVTDPVTVTVPNDTTATEPSGNVNDHVVFESGLTNGTSPNSSDLKVDSNFTIAALDGLASSDAVNITYTAADGTSTNLSLTKAEVEALNTTNKTITTKYGELVLKNYSKNSDGTITVAYDYTLKNAPGVAGTDTSDSFTITAKDRGNVVASQALNIKIVDDAPTAKADTATVDNADNKATGNALGNDTLGADRDVTVTDIVGPGSIAGVKDAEGVITVEGAHGSLEIHPNGEFTYTRSGTGPLETTEEFTYTITDADGDTSTAKITITINDKAPVVTDDNGDPVVPAPVDPAVPGGPQHIVITPDRSVNESGLPNGSTANDGSNKTTGTITYTKGDGPHGVTITDKKGDEQPIVVNQVIETSNGKVTIKTVAEGTITYEYELTKPSNGDTTHDAFDVTITDTDGDSTKVTVQVAIVDDVPTAVADKATVDNADNKASGNALTADASNPTDVKDVQGADGAVVSGLVAGNSVGTPSNVDVGTEVQGSHGKLTIQTDGSYIYERDNGDPLVADDVFTYTIKDADGDISTATITISINDKAPIITDGGVPVAPTPVDPTDPAGPSKIVVTPNGSVSESGLPSGSNPDNGDRTTTGTITYDKGDGGSTDHTLTVKDKDSVVHTVAKNLVINTPNGKVTITDVTDGEITYTYELTSPTDKATQTTDEFEVSITDKDGDVTQVTVVVDIVNDAPSAAADIGEVKADETLTVPAADGVLKNDNSGADGWKTGGAVVGVIAGTNTTPSSSGAGTEVQGTYGKLTINPDGSYSYVAGPAAPGADPTVEDVFTYTVQDSDGDQTTTTLTITVINNQPPVAENDFASTDEDTPVSGNLLINDRDPDDGDILTVTEITVGGKTTTIPADGSSVTIEVPGKGKITVNKNGGYTFTPNPGVIGQVPDIDYKITDGKGGEDDATLNINIKPGNPYVAPPPSSPADGGFNSPPVSPADPIRSRGLMDSAVITDPSVFYEGERWDDVRRLPIPLHPVVYVNNEVSLAQQQRAADDMRAHSAPDQVQPFLARSSSLAMGLGQDQNLFVSHAVRDTQETAAGLDSRVSGRLSRTDLSADDLLFSADLRSPEFMSQDTEEAPEPKQKLKRGQSLDDVSEPVAEDEITLQTLDVEGSDLMSQPAVNHSVAASFTEQLRGTSKRLPFAAHDKNFLI